MPQSPESPGIIGRWSLWRLPVRVRAFVLVVDALAVAVAVAGAVVRPPAAGDIGVAAVLVGAGVLHTEAATGIERVRRRVAKRSYFDLSSVWTFAAGVLLPLGAIAAVVVALYVHLWYRVWRPAHVAPHRHAFTMATVFLAAAAAHLVSAGGDGVSTWIDTPGGVGTAVLAVGLYWLVNIGLIAAAIALSERRSCSRGLIGHWDDNLVEAATLCLGALTAVALTANLWLVVAVLPPLLVLHRAVHVRRLEEVASTDAKTGLLNAAAWHARASWEVQQAQRAEAAVGVLILDLDHFKSVNDAYGHLAGDGVLAAVAAAVRAEVRENDLVGRFGGEEFVVLLPGLPPTGEGRAELRAVAERIRRRVARLDVAVDTSGSPLAIDGLTTSVGGAVLPVDGTSLEQVLEAADAALYAAKGAGRNQVQLAPHEPSQVPEQRRGPVPVRPLPHPPGGQAGRP